MKNWDDISSKGPLYYVDRRSNYVIHINNHTIRYDYTRFNGYDEMLIAEYKDFGQESLQVALLCVFPYLRDAKAVWERMKMRGEVDESEVWDESITYESTTIPKP